LVPGAADSEYQPAPLDCCSLYNGLAEFNYPQNSVSSDFVSYALAALDMFFPLLAQHSSLASDEFVISQLMSSEHSGKAAGYPCNYYGATTKLEALTDFGFEQLKQWYHSSPISVIGITLKDELRPIGKDARLFRPQDVTAYIEGTILFAVQNAYLMANLLAHPLFVQFITPGIALAQLRRMLSAFGNVWSSDGTWWDTQFPLWVASILCYWRSRYMDSTTRSRVEEYYKRMYNAFCTCGGWLFQLVGQPSGQVNTTVDNSLGHIVLMAYHAWSHGMPLSVFRENILFFCCGDDLIFSSKHLFFSPVPISTSYASVGVFLEFDSLEPNVSSTFCGTVPASRKWHGLEIVGYKNRERKMQASCAYRHKKMSNLDHLQKLCSITQLMFMDENIFDALRKACFDFYAKCVVDSSIPSFSPDALGALRSTDPDFLVRKYTGWESF